jgi:formamidopyrimidine-DNA glycosylase
VPELPEVEIVRAGLAPAVTGARVEAVTVFDERCLRRHGGPAEDFVDRMAGAVLAAPRRRGKFLWIPAETDAAHPEALLVHLGMSGQVLLRERDAELGRLTRARLDIHSPEHGALRLDFVDQRLFGSLALDRLTPAADAPDELIPAQTAHIARDPLDELFDERRFLAALARRRTTVKRALLDQTLLSGVGNIYADEALWAARIHYDQPTETLSRAKARTLLAELRAVLVKALAEGGTSFDSQYLNVNGQAGYFAHSLNAYGRQGEPCPRCGTPIVREVFMNRGSHFCPKCQRVR